MMMVHFVWIFRLADRVRKGHQGSQIDVSQRAVDTIKGFIESGLESTRDLAHEVSTGVFQEERGSKEFLGHAEDFSVALLERHRGSGWGLSKEYIALPKELNFQLLASDRWDRLRQHIQVHGLDTSMGKRTYVDLIGDELIFYAPVSKLNLRSAMLTPKSERQRKQDQWILMIGSAQQIFGSLLRKQNINNEVKVLFGSNANGESVAFQSRELSASRLQEKNLEVGRKQWKVLVGESSSWIIREVASEPLPIGFVVFGTLNAILLGLLVWMVANTRWTAEQLAIQMTKKSAQQNEQLKTVINNFPGMVSWVSRDLTYLGVNDELARTYGKSADSFVGQEVGKLSSNPTGKSFRQTLIEFFNSSEERRTLEMELPTPKGTLYFLTTYQKYQDKENVMVVSIDVTEQKNLQRQYEETRSKALNSARLSALGEMAGGMAHEINNPLMIIYAKITNLKKLLAPSMSEESIVKSQAAIAKVEKTIERISKIIRGLRTIARDGENDPFQFANVSTLIADTVELCRHRLTSKSIQFLYPENLDPSLEVECRSTQVIQVLLNLIGNAVDAVEAREGEKWVRLEVQTSKDHLILKVQDSGPGIPEALHEKIMQPFFTTKEIGKGTGLGLSISKGIADSHKGSLSLEPDAKQTCFVLTLPWQQGALANQSEAA